MDRFTVMLLLGDCVDHSRNGECNTSVGSGSETGTGELSQRSEYLSVRRKQQFRQAIPFVRRYVFAFLRHLFRERERN